MAAELKKKRDIIVRWERKFAGSVSFAVIQSRPIGVWEFLIPIMFILTFMKGREQRDLFVQNFMFTKNMALQAAFDIVGQKHTRDQAISQIKARTDEVLASPEVKGLYSEGIRSRQLIEIDLLIDHYCKLLQTEGKDYIALVIGAYQNKAAYTNFITQLKAAEKDVADAARETLGTKADEEALAKLDSATDRIRAKAANMIFQDQ